MTFGVAADLARINHPSASNDTSILGQDWQHADTYDFAA
jgi:hypothetical protein